MVPTHEPLHQEEESTGKTLSGSSCWVQKCRETEFPVGDFNPVLIENHLHELNFRRVP